MQITLTFPLSLFGLLPGPKIDPLFKSERIKKIITLGCVDGCVSRTYFVIFHISSHYQSNLPMNLDQRFRNSVVMEEGVGVGVGVERC